MPVIFTRANVPDDLANAWLQHLRDFDTAHPGCHFEVMVDEQNIPMAEMVEMIRVTPGLTFSKILMREPVASVAQPVASTAKDSLAYVDAADDLYAAFADYGKTPGQREALRDFAKASNKWADHPRKGAAVTSRKS